jgi:predicted  nucleic acid-binding Zn-ribbon protein
MRRARKRLPSLRRSTDPAQEHGSMSKRHEYLATMKKKLDKWGAEMDALEVRANSAMEGTRLKYQEQFRDLRSERMAGEKKLEAIKAATEESWENLKVDTENLWDAFEDSVYAFKAHFE